MFSARTLAVLARGVVGRSGGPLYVQFYVTARCNLTCKQCNIIYANADVREATAAEIDAAAENLRRIGTAIVLLTGGEPFVRADLPQIVRSFTSRGIHVRAQTNGLAARRQLEAVVAAGARDISISVDSLSPQKQDFLNGSYRSSWRRMLETIALVTQTFPARHSFAAFGTVLSPQNILEIPNIIRFATRIGWYVSLVPAHIADPAAPFNFRSYDREMQFGPDLHGLVADVLAECRALKRAGFNLYDSDEYLANILRFVRGESVRWRRRNGGRCDSPELYFAIRPNGDMQVCCDHILRESYPVWHADFPDWYRRRVLHREVRPITRACPGCMYGSFPEISITAHYPLTALRRAGLFWRTRRPKPWPLQVTQLEDILAGIQSAHPVDHAVLAGRLEPVSRHADVTAHIPLAAVQ